MMVPTAAILRAAAKRDLVQLGALLIDAENADIASVVMAISAFSASIRRTELYQITLGGAG